MGRRRYFGTAPPSTGVVQQPDRWQMPRCCGSSRLGDLRRAPASRLSADTPCPRRTQAGSVGCWSRPRCRTPATCLQWGRRSSTFRFKGLNPAAQCRQLGGGEGGGTGGEQPAAPRAAVTPLAAGKGGSSSLPCPNCSGDSLHNWQQSLGKLSGRAGAACCSQEVLEGPRVCLSSSFPAVFSCACNNIDISNAVLLLFHCLGPRSFPSHGAVFRSEVDGVGKDRAVGWGGAGSPNAPPCQCC